MEATTSSIQTFNPESKQSTVSLWTLFYTGDAVSVCWVSDCYWNKLQIVICTWSHPNVELTVLINHSHDSLSPAHSDVTEEPRHRNLFRFHPLALAFIPPLPSPPPCLVGTPQTGRRAAATGHKSLISLTEGVVPDRENQWSEGGTLSRIKQNE